MIRLLLVAAVLAGPARAHEAQPLPGGASSVWDVVTIALLTAVGALYAAGVARLWRRAGAGHGLRPWRVACFAAGLLTLVAGVLTPLHELGDRRFAAHMAQHLLLMTFAAPLLALGAVPAAAIWALPQATRGPLATVAAPGRQLTRLEAATLLQVLTLWIWHAPAAYATALAVDGVHWLQHASLLGSALLFWEAVLGRRGLGHPGAAIFAVFVTALHSGLLGVLLTFAPSPIYARQSAGASDFGLELIEDQQLAGLLMWVPGGVVYAIAALGLAAVWIRGSSHRSTALVRSA